MGIHRSSTTDMDAADQRLIDFGRPEMYPPFADNSVSSSKYTWYSFFPMVSVMQGNMCTC